MLKPATRRVLNTQTLWCFIQHVSCFRQASMLSVLRTGGCQYSVHRDRGLVAALRKRKFSLDKIRKHWIYRMKADSIKKTA